MKLMPFAKRCLLAALPLMLAVTGGLLASCDGDEPERGAGGGKPQYITFDGRDRDGAWRNGRANGLTRDGGTDEIEAVTPDDIGVFAFGDGQNTRYVFRNRRVYSISGSGYLDAQTQGGRFGWSHSPTSDWPYTEDPAEAASVQMPWEWMRYRFFAYSPWYETDAVRVGAENYAGFNTFTWNNVPGFSGKDFILSYRIHDIDNRDGHMQTSDLVTFSMRHILSRIRFFFKMSPAYRTIRRIEINAITVLTAGKVKNATFNFKNDQWDETVNWSNAEYGNAPEVTLTNAGEGAYDVPTDYPEEPFNSVYVYPQKDFDELKLSIDYSVYDSKGVKTRNASVTNIVSIKPAWELLAGYYYDIKINVVPAYLYVLSDEDEDFDGYVIIRDEANWTTP